MRLFFVTTTSRDKPVFRSPIEIPKCDERGRVSILFPVDGDAGQPDKRALEMHVVCLGTCCSASERLRRLGFKQQSSFVEWMMALDFGDIIKLLDAAMKGRPWPVESIDRRHHRFVGTGVSSRHYGSREAMAGAFDRRAARLRRWVRDGDPILFVRHDASRTVTDRNAKALMDIVHEVNPDCPASMIVFTPPSLWHRTEPLRCRGAVRLVLPRDDAAYADALRASGARTGPCLCGPCADTASKSWS